MDRLRSPGGCPWDRAQTHTSLVPYLVEEAHEAAEALESGDRDHMVEELGDVLLQVAFHARVAEEDPEAPFDIDDVAAGIVAKLVRRHPHVFAGGSASTPGEVETSWEAIKAAEQAAAADGPWVRTRCAAFRPVCRRSPARRRSPRDCARPGSTTSSRRRPRATNPAPGCSPSWPS